MKKLRSSQEGMSIIEILLLIFLIIILILIGWYVWSQNNSSDSGNTDQQNIQTTPAQGEEDPTSDWVAYSNEPGKFSLKHPKNWVRFSAPEFCSEGLFLVGADADSVGKCASESFGQMAVASTDGDVLQESKLAGGYKNVTDEAVTINTVKGVKQSGEASGQQSGEEAIGGYEDGTKVVKYIFLSGGKTYTATYVQQASFPNALADFNLMVTKTLKFEP